MKRLILIALVIFPMLLNAQEYTLEQLFTIKYVYVRSELRAKHLEKKFFKFGQEVQYFEAQYDGKKSYFLECESDIILTDRLFNRHLLTRRLRRKLIEIKYE